MRRRFALAVIPLAAALVLVLGGCGADSGGDGVATAGGTAAANQGPPAPNVDEKEKGRQFARCMRENGVDMPDPGAGGDVMFEFDDDPQKVDAALKKCRQLMPGGGEPPKADAAEVEQMRK